MKKFNKTNVAIKAAIAITVGAVFGISTANAATAGQNYVGIKAGQVILNDNGVDDLKNATAFGIYGGHQFTPKMGVEAEYIKSKDTDISFRGIDAKYNVSALSLYGTYTEQLQNSPVFIKGKAGVARTEVEATVEGAKASAKETDIGLGAALGYQLNPQFDMQAEYTHVLGDTDSGTWSLGASYKF